MKVGIITGSYPPDACGVGDYSKRLVLALTNQGIEAKVITHSSWSYKSLSYIIKKINSSNSEVLHMQYPTVGYGYSILPQILCVLYPMVVTLHEFSQARFLRKIALLPFFMWAKCIIFTSKYEQQAAVNYFPWVRTAMDVIPIGSNMPISRTSAKHNDIVYFGLIRPHKGLEKVIEAAVKFAELSLPYRIKIVGSPDRRYVSYMEELKSETQSLPISWETGLPDYQVADVLAGACAAYLPFPDGASERRGSLLAVLENGVPVITTRGEHTSDELAKSVLFADGAAAVVKIVSELAQNDKYRSELVQQGYNYIKKFSWAAIAGRHIDIYQSVLHGNSRDRGGEEA
jgi:glycosyltransferase involved in cell wall biosynthesis